MIRKLVRVTAAIAGGVFACAAAAAPRADFDGDGRADVLWRNQATGENYLYPMNGTAIQKEGAIRPVPDLAWRVAGIGDFDGDGRSDILWRNTATGQNYIYFMNGAAIVREGFIRTVADLLWQIVGIGDFDGDGKDDVLWRHSSGQNYLYPMDGLAIKPSEGYLRTVPEATWLVAGIGDFDGDAKADVLWRNHKTGANYIYPMDGVRIKATEGFVRTVADTAWQVKGVGDLDGDGRADILWRHAVTGENYLYPMNGAAIKANEGYLRTVSALAWEIAALGDFDGDRLSDVFWRNRSTGENYLFPMEGTRIKPSEGYVRTVASQQWQVVNETRPAASAEPPELAGITRYHNDVRAAVQTSTPLPPLSWDPSLAATAAQWASQCRDETAPAGLIDHNPNRSVGHPYYVGENIYGSTASVGAKQPVDAWAAEKANYDYATNSCDGVCGHYTQIVWRNTSKVGCAVHTCSALRYAHSVVCNYGPGGNIVGQRPY